MTTLLTKELDLATQSGTIVMPLKVAKSLASLIVLADKANGTTAALQRINIAVSDNELIATVSDRYVLAVAKYRPESSDDLAFYLDHAMAKFISGIKPLSKYSSETITFSVFDNALTVSNQVATQSQKLTKANVPDLAAFIANAVPATEVMPFTLNLDFLAKFAKIVDTNGDKLTKWELGQLVGSSATRVGPVLLTTDTPADMTISGMIQPNYKR
jgi:DNA polymerase III sliding clamp (beta) subunit (PCNA family)